MHRILVEPRSENADEAVIVAEEIDAALDAAGIATPRLHHGVGPATWAVLDAAIPRGREIRIGFEDVLTLPDGRRAPDNAALVVEADAALQLTHRADAVVAVVQEAPARPASRPAAGGLLSLPEGGEPGGHGALRVQGPALRWRRGAAREARLQGRRPYQALKARARGFNLASGPKCLGPS